MNENWRYLYIALGAVTLMVAGLLVSYRWKMSRGVRPSESSLTLFDLKGQVSSFDSIAPLRSDSVEPDSALNKQLLLKQQKTLVRDMADEEGFRWQTELQQYRFSSAWSRMGKWCATRSSRSSWIPPLFLRSVLRLMTLCCCSLTNASLPGRSGWTPRHNYSLPLCRLWKPNR